MNFFKAITNSIGDKNNISGNNEQMALAISHNGSETLSIKVLGSGCAKCNALEGTVKEALSELGIAVIVEHISNFAEIAAYGVMSTPALVINNKVVSSGKLLSKDEVKRKIVSLRG